MFDAFAMIKNGGDWLGRARSWMQSRKHNGSTVTWGSHEVLQPPVTVREVEEIARLSAAAALNESPASRALGEILDLIDQGVLLKKADMTGEEMFNLNRALKTAEGFRKVKT